MEKEMEKGKNIIMLNGQFKFEGDYLNGQIWTGEGYNKNGNMEYKIINGTGYIKDYYNNGELKFEGEYLNGKKSGKGKKYYLGELEFEGEYVNGKRNGKGKEFNIDGILIFEGEYVNGKRNEIGKEYNFNKSLLFEGEYFNGKRWNGLGYNINGNLEYEIKNGKVTQKNITIKTEI